MVRCDASKKLLVGVVILSPHAVQKAAQATVLGVHLESIRVSSMHGARCQKKISIVERFLHHFCCHSFDPLENLYSFEKLPDPRLNIHVPSKIVRSESKMLWFGRLSSFEYEVAL